MSRRKISPLFGCSGLFTLRCAIHICFNYLIYESRVLDFDFIELDMIYSTYWNELPFKYVFHPSIHPSKLVFHQKSSSIKLCLSSKFGGNLVKNLSQIGSPYTIEFLWLVAGVVKSVSCLTKLRLC